MADRRSGAAAVLPAFYASRIDQRAKEEQERRDFDRRLQEVGIKGEQDAGRLGYDVQTRQFQARTPQTMDTVLSQLTGRPGSQAGSAPQGQGAQAGELPEGMKITQTIKTPQGTITVTRGAEKPPKLAVNVPQLLSKFPLQPGPVDEQGNPKQALDLAPHIGVERAGIFGQKEVPVGADYTGRQLLGRLTNAVMNDPSAVNRGSFRRVMQRGQLESFQPQLRLLAGGVQEHRNRGTPLASVPVGGGAGEAGGELPDPSDPSLSEDGVSTEGAQYQTSDGTIFEVQNGEWVRLK